MLYSILIMGLGGDGAQTLGKILLIASELNNYSATFYPFYGSQMRGGESSCIIKIDTEKKPINNPTLNEADYFLILNDKYLSTYDKYKTPNTKLLSLSDAEKKEKNFNLLLLKKFANTINIFADDSINQAINIKFR